MSLAGEPISVFFDADVRATCYPREPDHFKISIGKIDDSGAVLATDDMENIIISGFSGDVKHFELNLDLKEFGLSARKVYTNHIISGRCANYIDKDGRDPSDLGKLSCVATFYKYRNSIRIDTPICKEFWIDITLT